jgi:hypothetical protein
MGLQSTYHHVHDRQHAACNMRRMARAVQHPTRSAGPPQTRKRSIFVRATGVGGERSTIASERNAPNARVRTMRTSPTTDVSWVRARAQPCTADGTHLGLRLRLNQPFGLQTSRPTGAGADAKPNSQCVASYVPMFAARGAVPLTVSRDVLCCRPTRCPPTTPADRTQCDAHIMPRVCRRIPKSAVCAVLRACRGMAWLAGRRRSARTMPAAAPPPPPRRTRRASSYALHLGEAFACADSGRFGVRPASVALGSTALPVIVRDGLAGAADEQRHGGFGAAVDCRVVQRCAPAGRPRRNRQSRRPTTPPDGPREMGAPAVVVLGVQVGARDDELLDDRVMVAARRIHQGGAPIPAHGGALRRG